MKNIGNKLWTGAKIIGATALIGLTLNACKVQNQVQNYTPIEKAKQYKDRNGFQMDFVNFGQGSYGIKALDRYNTRDSLLSEDIYFKATDIKNLTLEEAGGTSDSFIWRGKPLYFKETTDKIYLGKIDASRRVEKNKTHLTNRDWKTKTQKFFGKTVKIDGVNYLTKKIGNKLYLVEAPRNQRNQKFKEFTNFGTRDYFIQAKQGESSIYVADLTPLASQHTNGRMSGLAKKASEGPNKPMQTNNNDFYIVKPGDNFGKICKKFGMDFEQGKNLNPQIENYNKIFPGDTIYLNPTNKNQHKDLNNQNNFRNIDKPIKNNITTTRSNTSGSKANQILYPQKNCTGRSNRTSINAKQTATVYSRGNVNIKSIQNVSVRVR